MKLLRFSLYSAILCFAIDTIHAENTPIGYVIYRERGFHTDSQARLIEVQSVKEFPAVTKAVSVSGNSLEIHGGQKPDVYYLPAAPGVSGADALRKLDTGIQKYPQHRVKLTDAKEMWAADAEKRKAALITVTPEPQSKGPTLTFITTDGEQYTEVEIAKQEPDGLLLVTDSGITKIPFEKLPPEIQQQFSYDPEAAAQFRQKLQEDSQKVALSRQRGEEERSKQQQQLSSTTSQNAEHLITLSPAEIKQLTEKIEKQGPGTIYRNGRESPVIKGFHLFMNWKDIYANVSRLVRTPFTASRTDTTITFSSDSKQVDASLGGYFCGVSFSPEDHEIREIRIGPVFINHLFKADELPRNVFFQRFLNGYNIPTLSPISSEQIPIHGGIDQTGPLLFTNKIDRYRYTDDNGWSITFVDDSIYGLSLFLTRIPTLKESKIGD